MKIINIDEEYIFGGPERRIVNVASELEKMGVKTIIFMPISSDKSFLNYSKLNKVRTLELSISPLSLIPERLFRYLTRFFHEILIISLNIKKINPDIVHINGAYQFKSAIAAKLAGFKVVWHVNNTHANPLVFFTFQIISLFCADGYIAASKAAKNYFLNFWWQKSKRVFIIQAPIKVIEYSSFPKEIKGDLSIGTISGFNRQKNPVLFAKTASLIANEFPHVKFSLAAHVPKISNKYLKEFDQELEKTNLLIDKLGFVKDIPRYLESLDIFLYVSSWEGSPTALWEAMASSLPIVTTNVGSAAEFIGEKFNSGILVNENDPNKLFLAIKKIIMNPLLRKTFGSNASKIAKEKLNLTNVAKSHKIAYEQLIS
tara:strand:- start:2651 stop:3766 length:1116 start_codon:yes stop_codon:yes gene_type:complete